MTDIYEESKQQAINDINEYGRTVNLVSIAKSGTAYDPVITETLIPCKMLQSNFLAKEIDGTLIKATDKKFLLAGNIEPTTEMLLKDGDIKYSIVNVFYVKPGDTLILSKIQARL